MNDTCLGKVNRLAGCCLLADILKHTLNCEYHLRVAIALHKRLNFLVMQKFVY